MRKWNPIRRVKFLCLCIVLSVSLPAMGVSSHLYVIPAQRLHFALSDWSEIEGVSYGIDADLKSPLSNGVEGDPESEAAVCQLLQGTGFTFVRVERKPTDVFAIVPESYVINYHGRRMWLSTMMLVCCAGSPERGVFEYRSDPHYPYPAPTVRISKQVVFNVCHLAEQRLDMRAAMAVVEDPKTQVVRSYDNETVLGMYCRSFHFGRERSTTQFVDVCDQSVGEFRKAVVAGGGGSLKDVNAGFGTLPFSEISDSNRLSRRIAAVKTEKLECAPNLFVHG